MHSKKGTQSPILRKNFLVSNSVIFIGEMLTGTGENLPFKKTEPRQHEK